MRLFREPTSLTGNIESAFSKGIKARLCGASNKSREAPGVIPVTAVTVARCYAANLKRSVDRSCHGGHSGHGITSGTRTSRPCSHCLLCVPAEVRPRPRFLSGVKAGAARPPARWAAPTEYSLRTERVQLAHRVGTAYGPIA